MSKYVVFALMIIAAEMGVGPLAHAAPRKPHSVVLGAVKRVSYSKTGDPSGAATGEDALKVRALLVDGVLKAVVGSHGDGGTCKGLGPHNARK